MHSSLFQENLEDIWSLREKKKKKKDDVWSKQVLTNDFSLYAAS